MAASWSCAEVGIWLKESNLGNLCQKFQDENITGEALLELTKDDLTELRLTCGDKKILANRIAELQTDSVANQRRPRGTLITNTCSSRPDFFICHTKSSQLWECGRFAQFQIRKPLRDLGFSVFFDVKDLQGQRIPTCEQAAAESRVLIAVLDDAFPSEWCLREMAAAKKNGVPIQTVLDTAKFTWRDAGKESWRRKRVNGQPIDESLIQYAFLHGTFMYNGFPDYADLSESLFLEVLLRNLPLWGHPREPSGLAGHGSQTSADVPSGVDMVFTHVD
jgi:hypothetical protein